MKKIKYPDYANSTVSLANSILKYFGAPVHHETLGLLDRKFAEREYENVVVILLDGMGKCIVDGNLEPDGFFASHLAGTYSAVFPPTTVAATTSICSGLYPVEHCWLGWDCYYPKIDKTVTVFLNREAGTDETERALVLFTEGIHERNRVKLFFHICKPPGEIFLRERAGLVSEQSRVPQKM